MYADVDINIYDTCFWGRSSTTQAALTNNYISDIVDSPMLNSFIQQQAAITCFVGLFWVWMKKSLVEIKSNLCEVMMNKPLEKKTSRNILVCRNSPGEERTYDRYIDTMDEIMRLLLRSEIEYGWWFLSEVFFSSNTAVSCC